MFSIFQRQNTQCSRYSHDLSDFGAAALPGAA